MRRQRGAAVNGPGGLPPGDYQIAVDGIVGRRMGHPGGNHGRCGTRAARSRSKPPAATKPPSGDWANPVRPPWRRRRGRGTVPNRTTRRTSKEWIEMDLGAQDGPRKNRVVCRGRTRRPKAAGVAGFPRDFNIEVAEQPARSRPWRSTKTTRHLITKGLTIDLHTVGGCYPSVRFIRLTATRLGEPAADDSEAYRLQLFRFQAGTALKDSRHDRPQ